MSFEDDEGFEEILEDVHYIGEEIESAEEEIDESSSSFDSDDDDLLGAGEEKSFEAEHTEEIIVFKSSRVEQLLRTIIPESQKDIEDDFIEDLLDLKLRDGSSVFEHNLFSQNMEGLSNPLIVKLRKTQRRVMAEIYDMSFLLKAAIDEKGVQYDIIVDALTKRTSLTKEKIANLSWTNKILTYMKEVVIPEKNKFLGEAPSTRTISDPREALLDRTAEEFISVIIFESPLLQLEKEKEENIVALQNDKGVVQTGIFDCGRCGSNEFRVEQKQTRGGDEGPTTLAQCTKCNYCFAEGR